MRPDLAARTVTAPAVRAGTAQGLSAPGLSAPGLSARRVAAACLVLLGLAACAGPVAAPQPEAARLSPSALTLTMSDGRLCRLPRAGAAFDGAAGWGGPVQGCPGVARIEVALERPSPLAAVVRALFAALTLEEAISPPAEVRVIAPSGRVFVFASPEPPER